MSKQWMTIGFLDNLSAEELLHYRLENRSFLQPFSPSYEEAFFTLHGQREWLNDVKNGKLYGSGYTFGIFLMSEQTPTEETFMGLISICPIFRGSFQNAFVSYELGEKWNNQGFTTKALEMVCNFAFHTLRLHRLELAVLPHNTSSIRVAEKNGFTLIGRSKQYTEIAGSWQDHLLYEKINEDV